MLNASKRQAVAINNKSNVYIPQITINGTAIESTASLKNLGVIFDSKLNFRNHSRSVMIKIFIVNSTACASLHLTRHFLKKKASQNVMYFTYDHTVLQLQVNWILFQRGKLNLLLTLAQDMYLD